MHHWPQAERVRRVLMLATAMFAVMCAMRWLCASGESRIVAVAEVALGSTLLLFLQRRLAVGIARLPIGSLNGNNTGRIIIKRSIRATRRKQIQN